MRKKNDRSEHLCPTMREVDRVQQLEQEVKRLRKELANYEQHRQYSCLRDLALALEDLQDIAVSGWQSQTTGVRGGRASGGGKGDGVIPLGDCRYYVPDNVSSFRVW